MFDILLLDLALATAEMIWSLGRSSDRMNIGRSDFITIVDQFTSRAPLPFPNQFAFVVGHTAELFCAYMAFL